MQITLGWSTRQKGNERENAFQKLLEQRGYVCYTSRGSRGIDLIAHHAEWDTTCPHLAVEVGREGKPIRESFAKLRAARKCAGTHPIVARWIVRSNRGFWRIHVHEDAFYDDVDVALDVLRQL